MNPPLTPYHDKLMTFERQAVAISEFLEHLADEGMEVVKFDSDGSRDYETFSPEQLIAGFLHIDQLAFNAEKQALHDYARYVIQLAANASKAFDAKLVNE